MQLATTPALVRLQQLQSEQRKAFLVLGGDELPSVEGVNLHGNVDLASAGIILLGRVEAAELASVLDRAADPALPIADFGGNETLRRDFVGSVFDQASVQAMEKAFAPIWQRLSALPFKVELANRAEMTILRLAYTRGTPITAAFDPNSRAVVKYPLLGTFGGDQRHLEVLTHLDLLRPRHFTRTHGCAKCGSARLNVFESCPGCGGANLREEALLHHYRCGCQEIESHFRQDQLLVCPKCHRTLQHFGVDYGKPGTAVVCASCGATNSEPFVHLACLDCSAITPADEADSTDWYHYDLTDEGVRALNQGQLPQFDLAPLLESRTHTYSPREFRVLAMHSLKVAERFKQPLSVARMTVRNIDALIRERGAATVDAGFRRVVDAVVNELRSSDFVGIGTVQSTVIGFPGTSAKDLDVIMKRIRRTIDSTVTKPVELDVEIAEGDDIVGLLAGS